MTEEQIRTIVREEMTAIAEDLVANIHAYPDLDSMVDDVDEYVWVHWQMYLRLFEYLYNRFPRDSFSDILSLMRFLVNPARPHR